ncbi:Polyprenyl synthetase [Acidimicrobium ferrooxidans DSM 10331]|uniref:Polyprenyl synthetase n=1 Tax=Acidimicrobium ferrooxidans (strain DSM 10331 / JCM 15462 / NBRC 103882 / ICP) TaxID=525909 RepID=C7M344_ACIFD|nr:polyprenyl synthetase family protein [Acidimicrobium ferrooxidans]ACU53438.1 Polyprenyl synthetase [Acidimicrobium ferrooxidans DSM 10331]
MDDESSAVVEPCVAEPEVLGAPTRLVEARLGHLLDAEAARWRAIDERFAEPFDELSRLTRAGGKRLRPALAFWAARGLGVDGDDELLGDLLVAIELLHTFALVHDDIMDRSELRRGAVTVHARARDEHRSLKLRGEAETYGDAIGILVGDLALTLADGALEAAPLPVRATFTQLKLEVNLGQYLDVVASAQLFDTPEHAEHIALFKSAKYTVERPLHLGALLADPADGVLAALSRFALPLGLAFQLRDDVLGVFGDGARTRKPVGDDLREGKWTLLVAETRERLDVADLVRFDEALGDANLEGRALDDVLGLVRRSGALDRVEQRIDELADQAMDALGDLPLSAEARCALGDLATFIVARQH